MSACNSVKSVTRKCFSRACICCSGLSGRGGGDGRDDGRDDGSLKGFRGTGEGEARDALTDLDSEVTEPVSLSLSSPVIVESPSSARAGSRLGRVPPEATE